MAGNRHRHGKGWPDYGRKDHKRGPPAKYYPPRVRGPAQPPPRETPVPIVEEATNDTVAA